MAFDDGAQYVKQCIFDLDGLLIDSESLYTQVTQLILDKYAPGAIYTPEIKNKIMGQVFDKSVKVIIDEYKMEISPETYITDFEDVSKKFLVNCKLMPYVEETIKHVKKLGIPMGIATSSGLDSFKLKTDKNKKIFDSFDFIVTGDEVKAGKPDPEIFLKALTKFQDRDPKKTVVFEDSLNGVIAALRAGMYCVWIVDEKCTPPSLHVPDEVTTNSNALCKLNSLKEFNWSLIGKEDIKGD